MKITVIHGQNHKGTTYHIARMLTKKLGGEVTEFFLPKDMGEFCTGCCTCFLKSEKLCPHYEKLAPVTEAIDAADVLIFAGPVYAGHASGAMKSLLDHYAYRWMNHRPEASMFSKQAVCISTAAGAGAKQANKDVSDSLFWWGAGKIYSTGFTVAAMDWASVSKEKKAAADRKMGAVARSIRKNCGRVSPPAKTRAFFSVIAKLHKSGQLIPNDREYWEEKGWLNSKRPWK